MMDSVMEHIVTSVWFSLHTVYMWICFYDYTVSLTVLHSRTYSKHILYSSTRNKKLVVLLASPPLNLMSFSVLGPVLSETLYSTVVLSDPDFLTCFPAQPQPLLHEWPLALHLSGSSNWSRTVLGVPGHTSVPIFDSVSLLCSPESPAVSAQRDSALQVRYKNNNRGASLHPPQRRGLDCSISILNCGHANGLSGRCGEWADKRCSTFFFVVVVLFASSDQCLCAEMANMTGLIRGTSGLWTLKGMVCSKIEILSLFTRLHLVREKVCLWKWMGTRSCLVHYIPSSYVIALKCK